MYLYALGSNGSGQLALTHAEDVSTPRKCHFETPPRADDSIVHVVAGGNHTLLLTRMGYVYAAGCNADGRCGPSMQQQEDLKTRGEKDDDGSAGGDSLLCFRRVVLTDALSGSRVDGPFRCVAATWEGSILVASVAERRSASAAEDAECREDRVFVMGSNGKGELGLGVDAASSVEPGMSIAHFPPAGTTVSALAGGMAHSVAVLSNGDVYGWGAARKGQLGEALKGGKVVWSPARIEGVPFPAVGAVCGREFTVVVGRKEMGEFVVLGDRGNRWGVLDVPAELGAVGFFDIAASWHGIYVHLAASRSEEEVSSGDGPPAGSVVAWGRNDRGQLPPADLPPVAKLAVGSEHVLALLEDGSVVAFGWGEHGNCGPETDSRGNVASSYRVISLPEAERASGRKVVGIGAGCATSWLIVR